MNFMIIQYIIIKYIIIKSNLNIQSNLIMFLYLYNFVILLIFYEDLFLEFMINI